MRKRPLVVNTKATFRQSFIVLLLVGFFGLYFRFLYDTDKMSPEKKVNENAQKAGLDAALYEQLSFSAGAFNAKTMLIYNPPESLNQETTIGEKRKITVKPQGAWSNEAIHKLVQPGKDLATKAFYYDEQSEQFHHIIHSPVTPERLRFHFEGCRGLVEFTKLDVVFRRLTPIPINSLARWARAGDITLTGKRSLLIESEEASLTQPKKGSLDLARMDAMHFVIEREAAQEPCFFEMQVDDPKATKGNQKRITRYKIGRKAVFRLSRYDKPRALWFHHIAFEQSHAFMDKETAAPFEEILKTDAVALRIEFSGKRLTERLNLTAKFGQEKKHEPFFGYLFWRNDENTPWKEAAKRRVELWTGQAKRAYVFPLTEATLMEEAVLVWPEVMGPITIERASRVMSAPVFPSEIDTTQNETEAKE